MSPRNIVCNKCNKKINIRTQKHIFCDGDCGKKWHVPSCNNIAAEKYEEMLKDNTISWFCAPCKTKRASRRITLNTNNENENIFSPRDTLSNSNTTLITRVNSSANKSVSLEMIYEEIKSTKSNQESFQRTVSNLEKTLTDYKLIIDGITKENVDLRNENEILNTRIDNIEHHIDTANQQKLDQNIIINGVTETETEDIKDIVTTLCTSLKVQLNENEIDSAYRLKTASRNSGLPRSIVVKFTDKKKRNEILEHRKAKITTKILDMEDERNIYIAEQLTYRRQYLFKKARDVKRNKKVMFAWVKDGDIFIRRTEKSRVVKVINTKILNNLNYEPESDE